MVVDFSTAFQSFLYCKLSYALETKPVVFPEEFNSRFAQVLVYGLVITFTYQTSLFIQGINEL